MIEAAAQSQYYSLDKKDSEAVYLLDNKTQKTIRFTLIRVVEFDSVRKMNTVVVKTE